MIGLILLLQTLVIAVSGPTTSPEYLPVRVADAAGLFAREGLQVQLKNTRAEVGAAEALGQGQVDLAATSFEAMLRFGPRLAYQAPRLVFGLTAAPPVVLLVSRHHTGTVKTLKDLRGRHVGLAAPGAPEHTWLIALLSRAGIRAHELDMVSIGTRGLVGALESGEIEAGLLSEPFATRLASEEGGTVLADFRTPAGVARAFGTTGVGAAIFGRKDRLPGDAELAALRRALLAAEALIAGTEAEALAAQLPPALVGAADEFRERVAATRDIYVPDGRVSGDDVAQAVAVAKENQPLPLTLKIPPARELLHLGSVKPTAPPARSRK